MLSLLPAVLLHISLRSRHSALWVAGYGVSSVAVLLHIGDLITTAPRFHYAAILLVTVGFGVLTTISVVRETMTGPKDGSGPRLAGAMVLFLFAISFVHFESAHELKAWSGEAALHHAGIPLALFVLLQDYRFLLFDAFIRFLVNGMLAALAVWVAFQAEARFALLSHARRDSFRGGSDLHRRMSRTQRLCVSAQPRPAIPDARRLPSRQLGSRRLRASPYRRNHEW